MMRRVAFVWLMVLLAAGICLAQQRTPVREMKRTPRVPPLRGEQKLCYLVKQLDLSAEDQEFVEGLLEVYRDQVDAQKNAQEQEGDLLERVRVLYAQMEEAEKAGDTARAEALREQMVALGPGVPAERQFFDSLNSVLSDKQKVVLEKAQQRLGRVPDGALRPIDVLLVAQGLDLPGEQQRRLSKVLQDFRVDMRMQQGRLAETKRETVLARIIGSIREILTPEQASRFDREIEKLRPEAAPTAEAEEPQQEPEDEDAP